MNRLLNYATIFDGYNAPPTPLWNGAAYVRTLGAASFTFSESVSIPINEQYAGTVVFTTSTTGPFRFCLYDSSTSAILESLPITPGVPLTFDFSSGGVVRPDGLGVGITRSTNSEFTGDVMTALTATLTPYIDAYNCDCDCGYPTRTLAELRANVAIAMGYSAQIAALPASVIASINYQLNLQQQLVLADLVEINAIRYFTWNFAAGESKFCTTENLETCRNQLAATRITDAYVVTEGNVITKLFKGIDVRQKASDNPRSTPTRYEVRSCIEIWPPPAAAGKLLVKGSLAHVPMVNNTDVCLVDPVALELRTIAFLKGAKGHPDAGNYSGQYGSYIANLCAESHNDMRYVPQDTWARGCDVPDDILTHLMERRIYETVG